MKKLFLFVLVAAFAFNVYGQSEAKINKIMSPRNIRAAFRGIKTDTATVTGNRTFTGTVTIDNDITLDNGEVIDNDTDGMVNFIFNEDSTVLGEFVVSSSVDSPNVADNDHFDFVFKAEDDSSDTVSWTKIIHTILDVTDDTEDSKIGFQVIANGTASVPLELTTNTLTLDQGATITNPDADTLKVTEAVFQVNGGFGIGSAPTVTITDVSEPATGRAILTINGTDYLLVAASDSANWKN